MFRMTIGLLLIAALGFGQDLRVKPLSMRQLEEDAPKIFKQNSGAPQTASATPVKQKKSRKGLWIGIAVAAGVAVTALVLVDKRLSNEGAGIFR
jgi:hypothetical protein